MTIADGFSFALGVVGAVLLLVAVLGAAVCASWVISGIREGWKDPVHGWKAMRKKAREQGTK